MTQLDDTASYALAFAILIVIWGCGVRMTRETRRLGAVGEQEIVNHLVRGIPFETSVERTTRWQALHKEQQSTRESYTLQLTNTFAEISQLKRSVNLLQARAAEQLSQAPEEEESQVMQMIQELRRNDRLGPKRWRIR